MSEFLKVLAVIRSCVNSRQNAVADAMIWRYEAEMNRRNSKWQPLSTWNRRYIQIRRDSEYLRDENDRILIEICGPNK